MKSPDSLPQFENDIFPAELNEIANRRANAGLEKPDTKGAPSVEKGLIGLAFSGGGIRSATFGLGVLQALVAKKKFKFIDYLSTVSGGGFIGSCISSALNSRGADEYQFENRMGDEDPDAVKHLRNSGNYLIPGGLVNKMRLPTTVLRGILLNLFLIVPALILAVFVTEILSEVLHSIEYMRLRPINIITPFVFMVIVFSFISSAFRHSFTWIRRNAFERFLAKLFVLTILVLILIPTLWLVRFCIDATWAGTIKSLFDLSELGLSSFKVIILIAGLALFFLIIKKFRKLSKITGNVAILAAGILGPVFIFAIYLIFCVLFIESAYFEIGYKQALTALQNKELKLTIESNEFKLEERIEDKKDHSKPAKGDMQEKVEEKIEQANLDNYRLIEKLEDEKDQANPYNIVRLFVGKGLIDIIRNHDLTLRIKKGAPESEHSNQWQVIYSQQPADDSTTAKRKMGRETIHVRTFEFLETKNYFFIPDFSIFEVFRKPKFTFTWGRIKSAAESLGDRLPWKFYLTGILIFIFNVLFVNINITSFHGFYRDRLSQAYLFHKSREGMLNSNDHQRLSDLNREGSIAPYHLINTSLNIPDSNDRNLRGRDSDFFTFSKHYCGSHHTGYCETKLMEKVDPHINLGTAMAISGAAAAPNMGTMTLKQFVFVLTLLNIRLDYWAPNPLKINTTGLGFRKFSPNVGPRYLLKEAMGVLNARGRFINVSDGGHIENLGVYELLKRRCKLIIASDVEADPKMVFNGLVKLMRFAEIDMGISIDIDLSKIRAGRSHWALGKICYGTGKDSAGKDFCKIEYGYLLYIKSSLTGDENEYIRAYQRIHEDFPDETTADQFFNETQFECYRSLGEHITAGMLEDMKKYEDEEYRGIRKLFQN